MIPLGTAVAAAHAKPVSGVSGRGTKECRLSLLARGRFVDNMDQLIALVTADRLVAPTSADRTVDPA